MKIEKGKLYRNRSGSVLLCITHREGTFTDTYEMRNSRYLYHVNINGDHWGNHELDIIEEFYGVRKLDSNGIPIDSRDQKNEKIVHEETKGGNKFDDGKPMFSCLPPDALLELGKVAALGAKKYGANNYRLGISNARYIDAAFRHLIKYMSGEDCDPIDGNNHLASSAWNCLSALQAVIDNPEMDTRFKKNKS